MAEQYAPIAKDSSLNTTDLTPKNIADVLQDGLATLANSVKPTADEIPFDNTGTSLVSTDVEGAIKEINNTYTSFSVTARNTSGVSDCEIDEQKNYIKNGIVYLSVTLHSVNNTAEIKISLPNNITLIQAGGIGVGGKGTRWYVSAVQYLFIGADGLFMSGISANTYYHITIALPATIS